MTHQEEPKKRPVLEWKAWKSKDHTLRIHISTGETDRDTQMRSYHYQYQLENDIAMLEPFERVQIYVDSRGGDSKSAMGIIAALAKIPRRIPMRILIKGQCASAATFVLGLRGECYIVPSGTITVHRGTITHTDPETGEETESRDGIGIDSITQALEETYRNRMRRNLKWREYRTKRELPGVWMAISGDTTFTAEQAVKMGLADGVMTAEDFEKSKPDCKAARKRLALRFSAVLAVACMILGFMGWQAYTRQERANHPIHLTEGTVIRKEYWPEAQTNLLVGMSGSNGMYQDAIPVQRREQWRLWVENDGITQQWIVSEETYNRVEVGQKVKRKPKEE